MFSENKARPTASELFARLSRQLASEQSAAIAALKRAPFGTGFQELPSIKTARRLVSLANDDCTINECVQRIDNDLAVNGGLASVDIAFLILVAQGATDRELRARLAKERAMSDKELRSRINSEAAKRPRNRLRSPYSAAAFAEAVRKESAKRQGINAWGWLEVDAEFGGFEVIALSADSVQFRFGGKNREPISKATFLRRWAETKRS